jgi:uncharacterized protein (DUF169 family)
MEDAMTWQSAAKELEGLLGLEHAPIGISRMRSAPAGAARAGRDLPSACAYWREGEHRLIYADAAEHKNCPIGMMVMGFEPPAEVASEAQILVGNMAELGYLDPAEVAHLPMLPGGHAGVLYGPVQEFPERPEAVLLICSPSQAMLLSESLGGASLMPDSGRPLLGRPACSVISRAVLNDAAEMSLACKGARVLAELGSGEMLVAIPGDMLEASAEALRKATSANAGMEKLYREKQSRFATAG